MLQEYCEVVKDQECLLLQKARIDWLKEGDRNTGFFHKVIRGRKHKGGIMTVCDENGTMYEKENVAGKFLDHFKNFLGTKDTILNFPTDSVIFTNKLSKEQPERMVRPVMEDEIKTDTFDIEDSKSPGPDGFTSRFFKAAWNIIGKEVCLAVHEFFSSGKLLGEMNTTLISLVPKIPTPNKVLDFRPIAFCNVLYKCISKIMTNRIKRVLGKLINENQSAFIVRRQITDNIILAQELLNGYNRKTKVKKCALNIDLQIAYDTLDWQFLRKILEQFGFHNKMVGWIMTCVTITKFTINVIGERIGYFNGGRGLRQGDPISTYLFTIAMEVFNLLMKKNIENDDGFKFHQGCKNMKITHLGFADDLIVFSHGDCNSVRRNILKLRDKVRHHIYYKLGNGKSVSAWYDNWSIEGPLCKFISAKEIYDARLSSDFPSLTDDACDGVVWVTRAGHETRFVTRTVWQDMCCTGNKVIWKSMIWFPQSIPRHSFVLWMAVQGRLMTQDKIVIWKPNEDMECALCKQCLDSDEHLFFLCSYTNVVWEEMQKMLEIKFSYS
ncbi:RNA-directed DNA polymerase, eukaryota, reverse transcriptase zinc-binding domain protein [Tanacetum coccineum]